jgi:uncharacterized protein (DUF433 family)
MSTTLDTLLVCSPDVCGGRLRIEGTRITVMQIATLFRQGLSAEDMTHEYPHAPEGGIYAALAYYLANRGEINTLLADEDAEYDKLKSDQGETAGR